MIKKISEPNETGYQEFQVEIMHLNFLKYQKFYKLIV